MKFIILSCLWLTTSSPSTSFASLPPPFFQIWSHLCSKMQEDKSWNSVVSIQSSKNQCMMVQWLHPLLLYSLQLCLHQNWGIPMRQYLQAVSHSQSLNILEHLFSLCQVLESKTYEHVIRISLVDLSSFFSIKFTSHISICGSWKNILWCKKKATKQTVETRHKTLTVACY